MHFSASTGCLKAQRFSASGGLRPGALPLDPVGGSAPDPRYRLALHALAMCPPKSIPGSATESGGNLAPTVISKSRRLWVNIYIRRRYDTNFMVYSLDHSVYMADRVRSHRTKCFSVSCCSVWFLYQTDRRIIVNVQRWFCCWSKQTSSLHPMHHIAYTL